MTLEVVLPYPPSVNHYWRMFRGRMVISREGRAFRERVCSVLAAAGVKPMSGALAVEMDLYPPDRRRRDIDNGLKACLDGLQHGGAYEDDSQITLLVVRKCAPLPGGKTFVTITQASP